ncbi:MAG: hypothetical protein N3I86_12220 [Verrucomicrobiae bacterium]|nr:hypothetical protein [Verrucomicrobiae bacterium]
MTLCELVLRAIRGAREPRPAVGPLASEDHARLLGVTRREYTLGAEVLAECLVALGCKFQPDAGEIACGP